VANAARLTHSSGDALHSSTLLQAKGVLSKRLEVTWSQTSQESNAAAHSSICASVTGPGASTMLARRRASWLPVAQRASARSWSRPSSLATFRSSYTDTPNASSVRMP